MPAPIVAAVATNVAKTLLPKVLAVVLPILIVVVFVLSFSLASMIAGGSAGDADTSAMELGQTGCESGTGTVGNPREGAEWPDDAQVGTPDSKQLENAAEIIRAARDLNVPAHGQVIALAVAAQESGWKNLDHGHLDSLGLFQQRAAGWGSAEDRRNPHKAATMFFKALLKVDGWEKMPIGRAGQAVQKSAQASGEWYQDHEPIARAGVVFVSGDTSAGQCANNGEAMECPASPWPGVEKGLTPDALRVLRCGAQHQPKIKNVGGIGDRPSTVDDDHQTGRAIDFMIPDYKSSSGVAMGDELAAWFKANAKQLGVKYVIWNAKIWSEQRNSEGWRKYDHPSGGGDTLLHRDHVHVSVHGNAAGGGADSGGGSAVKPVKNYTLTARFGQAGSQWSSGAHTGLDFAAPLGTPILAPQGGKVAVSGWGGAYGNWVCIDVETATQLCFAHQMNLEVKVGDRVLQGQQIGHIGMTGNTNGPHLHFEVRVRGKTIDPETWLSDRGARP